MTAWRDTTDLAPGATRAELDACPVVQRRGWPQGIDPREAATDRALEVAYFGEVFL